MRKVEELLVDREYGCTPFYEYDYRFIVTEDYRSGISLYAKSFDKEVRRETLMVELNPNEIAVVGSFCRQLSILDVKAKKSNPMASFSVIFYGDKDFKDDFEIQSKMKEVENFIRAQHPEELGKEVVSDMYMSLLDEINSAKKPETPNTK